MNMFGNQCDLNSKNANETKQIEAAAVTESIGNI